MRVEVNYIGLKVEALKVSYKFHRKCYKNGKPKTMVLGGGVKVELQSNYETMRFLEEILTIDERHKNRELQSPTDSESYKKASIKFFDNQDYNIRTLELLDSYIANFKEIFHTVQKHVKNKKTNNFVKLEFKSASQIINKGITKNVFGWWMTNPFTKEEYQSPVQAVENTDEFYLSIKHLTDKKTLVPLGIPAFNGTTENKNIEFEIEVTENDIDEFIIELLQDNNVIYTVKSGEDNSPKNYKVGKHTYKWDGFDSNGIYDSTLFTTGKLKARIKGKRNGKEKTAESSEFAFEYKEVNWVDTKIDKNAKRIDVTLRVNLKDGGEKGTEEDCRETGSGSYAPITKHCPWEKIPKKDLTSGSPLKTRTKSFSDLEKLAINGLNYHWGRNQNHFIAKDVDINGEKYQIFVNTINTTENAMDDVSLIFNTNKSWMRSGNPGTVEDPISFVGNIVSREAICYNVGYIYEYFYKDNWDYQSENLENLEFKFTTAHEIGHTILKAYGGTFYSYGHKGSVNTITQKMKTTAPEYPKSGEIDIMPYYPSSPPPTIYNRYVASDKDVLGLLWLSKIEMK